MSTFKGVVDEFPDIRIDYFRKVPDRTPPLACFLSHVHSDHLQGLESLRSPFIYCSPGTRELLLRLEKYPHRMNFARGVLESRKVHYKHLKSLLVPEPWWVNSLVRHPVILPYTLGNRRLDKIYLDTTFAVKRNPYRAFPTKADGLNELLAKVAAYPDDTVFHFNSWTFGYEDVWIALASALGSKIHVDPYKMRLYQALTFKAENGVAAQEGSSICGFKCGNRYQQGCLTDNISVRLHSCEKGTSCRVIEASPVVWITPIITRASNGLSVPELGAGGGGGDLLQSHEIDLSDTAAAFELIKLCSEKIGDTQARSRTLSLITEAITSGGKNLSLDASDITEELEDMPLEDIANLLERIARRRSEIGEHKAKVPHQPPEVEDTIGKFHNQPGQRLPNCINFPYSRHSSYDELCHLVEVFKPMDVYPCTVDEDSWNVSVSMKALFGHLCSAQIFAHDQEMVKLGNDLDLSKPNKRPLGSANSDATTRYTSQMTESIARETTIDFHSKSPEVIPKTRDTIVEQTDIQSRPFKRPCLSKNFRNTSEGTTSTEIQSSTEASTDMSLDRRIQTIRASFEHGLDGSSARTTSPTSTMSAPILNGRSATKAHETANVAQSTSFTKAAAGKGVKVASRVETTLDAVFTKQTTAAQVAHESGNSPRAAVGLRLELAATHETKKPKNSESYSGSRSGLLHDKAQTISTPSVSNQATYLARDDFAATASHYECGWLACAEIFPSFKRLRQHVVDCHMVGVLLEGTTAYGCLWEGCANPKVTYHSSQDFWEEHMDSHHLCARKDNLRRLRERHDAPADNDTSHRSLPTPPKEAITDDLARTLKMRSSEPGATPAETIELSDTSSTSSEESLPLTIAELKKSFDEHRSGSMDADLAVIEDADTNSCSDEEETQLSLPDSAFDSQQSTSKNQAQSASRVRNRKEAYKAAKGLGGREWATYSSFNAGLSDPPYHEEEVELG
ncbi:MAG: hypothetical protein Q9187_006115 [Circinaria calcarea]